MALTTVIEATDANFEQLLGAYDKVVVKYYADWCGHCRLFAPRFERLAGQEEYRGIAFLKVNAEYNPGARRRGRVSYLPFFASFRGGQLLNFLTTNQEAVVGELLNGLAASDKAL